MVNAIDSTSERLSEFIERTEVKDFKYFPDRKGHLLSLANTEKRWNEVDDADPSGHVRALQRPPKRSHRGQTSQCRTGLVCFFSRLGRLVALEVLPFLMPCARTDVRTKAS